MDFMKNISRPILMIILPLLALSFAGNIANSGATYNLGEGVISFLIICIISACIVLMFISIHGYKMKENLYKIENGWLCIYIEKVKGCAISGATTGVIISIISVFSAGAIAFQDSYLPYRIAMSGFEWFMSKIS